MPSTPLRIAELRPGPDSGIIGITFAPGKKGRSLYGGYHDRDLDADLDVFAAWGAAAVVTLVEEAELEELQIRDVSLSEANGPGPTHRRSAASVLWLTSAWGRPVWPVSQPAAGDSQSP